MTYRGLRIRIGLLACLSAAGATIPCGAAPAAAQEALVLSGGGSRGLAHAGVLLALEELGYDPELVVGTSMGAVVGALHAAGYDPAEVRARLSAVEWSRLFGATPAVVGPAREIRYPIFALDLDLSQLRLSRGLLGQWRINRALARVLFDANARSRGDFDRLPRRYRAVATDLRTGDVVVLAQGDLARAARASMAVPGFFAPVEWDGRVLVDGGISDNLPTRVARALGATRIIAVEVSRSTPEIESQAPFAVIGRAIDLMQEGTQLDPIPPDVLVVVDLPSGFSGTQFPDDPSAIIDIGYQSARSLERAPAHVDRGKLRSGALPDSLSALVVEAPDSALRALAHHVFEGIAPGRYDEAAILRAVDRLYTSGLFEGVWPRVEEVDGEPALLLRLEGQPGLSLSAAGAYDNDRGGRGWMSLDRYQVVAGRPAIASAAVSLGGLERWATLSLRLHPRSRPSFTWSVGGYVEERDVRFFLPSAIGSAQVLRPGAWLALERPHLLRDRVATLALRGEWVRVENGPAGMSVGPLLRYASVDPNARVVGVPMRAEAEYRFAEIGYWRAMLAGSREAHLGPLRSAAVLELAAVSDDAPADVVPALGDDDGAPGLRWGEVRGRARAVGGIDFAYPVLAGFARLRLRVGGVAPAWDDFDDRDAVRSHAGAHVGGFWESPIGAVEVGIGANTRGDVRFDVSLGRDF